MGRQGRRREERVVLVGIASNTSKGVRPLGIGFAMGGMSRRRRHVCRGKTT